MADPMKIVVDVVNGEKVKALTDEIKKQEAAIRTWNQLQQQFGVSSQVAAAHQEQAAHAIQKANEQLKQVPQTATTAGRGLSQLAYAIDDVQYGFNAIVNNIPQIAMGLGAGAGIAGAAGIAAVALNQLIKHSGELADKFGQWWTGKPIELLEQLREKAEAAAKAIEKVPGFTQREEKAAQGMETYVQNAPKEKLIQEVMGALKGSPMTGQNDEATRAMLFKQKKMFGNQQTDEQINADIDKKFAKELQGRAEKLIGEALLPGAQGDAARAQLGALLPNRRDQMKALSAESLKRAEEDMKRETRMGHEAETDTAGRKEQEKMLGVEREIHEHPERPDAYFIDDDDRDDRGAKRREQARKSQQDTDKMNEERAAKVRKEIEKAEETKKTSRIRGLEDERTAVQRAQKDFDDQMWRKTHEMTRGKVMSGGAENLIKSFQEGAGGVDSPKELARRAHEQRMKTNKTLERIEDELKKEHRTIVR